MEKGGPGDVIDVVIEFELTVEDDSEVADVKGGDRVWLSMVKLKFWMALVRDGGPMMSDLALFSWR